MQNQIWKISVFVLPYTTEVQNPLLSTLYQQSGLEISGLFFQVTINQLLLLVQTRCFILSTRTGDYIICITKEILNYFSVIMKPIMCPFMAMNLQRVTGKMELIII